MRVAERMCCVPTLLVNTTRDSRDGSKWHRKLTELFARTMGKHLRWLHLMVEPLPEHVLV